MTVASASKVKRYRRLNSKYLEDADSLLKKGDYSQASEKFWSAAAEIVKAVAAKKSVKAKTHADLWVIVERLDEEHRALGLLRDFNQANYLHSNFYEDELRPKSITEAAQAVKEFIEKMEKLL